MNHKIKLYNNVWGSVEMELTEEQIIELHSRLQNKGEKYFFPKENEPYYVINQWGDVTKNTKGSILYHNQSSMMGTYKTKEQAESARDKQLALVRMWKWVQDNGLYWEPDFSEECNKYFPVYSYDEKKWGYDFYESFKHNFLFPHFKSREDCQKFIDNNLSDLNLFV